MFRQLGAVRQRAHVMGSSQNQQALPASSQGTHGSHEAGSQGTFGNPGKTPGFTPRYDGAPGESTRQATHDKLTTEPAKDPSKKDTSAHDTRMGCKPVRFLTCLCVCLLESSSPSPFRSFVLSGLLYTRL